MAAQIFRSLQDLIETTRKEDIDILVGLQTVEDSFSHNHSSINQNEEIDLCSLLNDPTEEELCLQAASDLILKRLVTYMM